MLIGCLKRGVTSNRRPPTLRPARPRSKRRLAEQFQPSCSTVVATCNCVHIYLDLKANNQKYLKFLKLLSDCYDTAANRMNSSAV